jgi:Ribonuclease G/E
VAAVVKGRVVVLDEIRGRLAAALLVDGRLEDLLVDPQDEATRIGAIHRATVDRPMKGQGGVFVKLAGGTGFLRQVSGLAPGQAVLVQVSGTAEAAKAVPVSTRLLFKSRYAIVTPGAPGRNISRRIRDEDARLVLDDLAAETMAGATPDLGLILRSACEGAEPGDIAEDIRAMRDLAKAVLADVSGPPELLVDGPDAHESAWRDWADPPPDEVAEGAGAFAAFDLPDLIGALLEPMVALPGGGHAMIEPTRALVAVDVNTGPDTSPAASLKANIALARDLPRQLRLRGLGGQIVIDFAPMPKKDRVTLEQVLRAAFKGEGGETSLAGWTTLGLFEMVRKRDRPPLAELLR